MPNQRSAYFTDPFVTSYRESNFAKSCTQISLVRTKINFPSRSFDKPTIEESFSKVGLTRPKNREIWLGYSRKKKTTSTKIRLRCYEKFTPWVYSIRSKNANGLFNWSVKDMFPGALPPALLTFALTDFARFICLSPRLSAFRSPRMTRLHLPTTVTYTSVLRQWPT